MQQLDECGGDESGFVNRAIQLSREKYQQWSHLLSLTTDKVAQYDMKERDIAMQRAPEI
jgi:hypothetical protein